MTVDEVRAYIRSVKNIDMPDTAVNGVIERARLRVASADGRWAWSRLLRQDFITTSANVADYTFPRSGSLIEPPSKILTIKGRLDSDQPIDFYTPEAFLAKRFNLPMEAACIKAIDDDGKLTITFSTTPTSAATYDVWYRTQPKGSADEVDFSFVPPENEDVFLYAAVMLATLGAKTPDEAKTFNDSAALYKDALNAAILNDYSVSSEQRLIAPPKSFDVLQFELLRLNNER